MLYHTWLKPVLLVVLVLLLVPGVVSALDIPFYLSLDSSDIGILYPDRVGKKVVWDEKYIAVFGMDSLKVGAFTTTLKVRAVPERDELEPRLDTMLLMYGLGAWDIAGMTAETGLGMGYTFQNRLVEDEAFDTYLFDRGRFNGLEAAFHYGDFRTAIGVGGNTHNQAMAKLRQEFSSPAWNVTLQARVSARDTHWNTPSVLPSISASYIRGSVNTRLDAGLNLLPAFENEPYRQETFSAAEITVGDSESTLLNLGGQYIKREFYPFESWRLDLGVLQRFGKFGVTPVLDIRNLDGMEQYGLQLLVDWHVARGFGLGLYYKMVFGDETEKSHCVGLQSSLRLDL